MVTDSIEQAAEYAIDVFLPFQEKDAEADRLKEIADYERPIEERKKKNAEAQAKMDKNASGESKQKQQESTPGKKKKRDSMPAAGHVNEKKPNAKKKFPVKDRKVDQDKKKKKFNGPSSRGLAPNEEILIASELREEL